ncbi:MAG: PIN domain-containing protein [Candidatus Asgardarchaeia archaeon]
MWIFDTTFIIDLINSDPGAINKAKEIDESPSLKAISVITVQEYLRGIYYLFSKDEKILNEKLRRAEKELSNFEILPIDYSIAKIAAEIDAKLLMNGTPVDTADVLIAATAIKYDLTLVTRNVRDFEKIKKVKELKIETY